jgi:cell division protein FtsQ
VHYALHLSDFSLTAVRLNAAPQRVDVAQIGEIVHNELKGNFFTIDLEATRKAFEKLPWVRKVSVRRHFPWQLDVDLEENVPLAIWNGNELVNTHGEIFAVESETLLLEATELHLFPLYGVSEMTLPKFIGQKDTAAEVSRMYQAFNTELAPLKQNVVQISLSMRRAWQLKLNTGMLIELGREQPQERLVRFVATYENSLAPLPYTVKYVDLRYRNGFAAYLPQVVASSKARQG